MSFADDLRKNTRSDAYIEASRKNADYQYIVDKVEEIYNSFCGLCQRCAYSGERVAEYEITINNRGFSQFYSGDKFYLTIHRKLKVRLMNCGFTKISVVLKNQHIHIKAEW